MKSKMGISLLFLLIVFGVQYFRENTDSGYSEEVENNSRDSSYMKVTKVSDGDTFWVLNKKGEREKVRFIGIDAPESVESERKVVGHFGKESSDFLKSYLLKKQVRFEYDVERKDRYGRTLAYVYLEDGTFVNDYLVRNGYAVAFRFAPNVKYANQFKKSERYARQNNLGLWKK